MLSIICFDSFMQVNTRSWPDKELILMHLGLFFWITPAAPFRGIDLFPFMWSSAARKKSNTKGGLVSKVIRRPFHPVRQNNLFLMYPCVMKYSFDCYWHFCQPHYMSIMGLLLTFRARVYWMAFINVDMFWPVADALLLVKGPSALPRFSGRIFKGSRWGGGMGEKKMEPLCQGFSTLAAWRWVDFNFQLHLHSFSHS